MVRPIIWADADMIIVGIKGCRNGIIFEVNVWVKRRESRTKPSNIYFYFYSSSPTFFVAFSAVLASKLVKKQNRKSYQFRLSVTI